MSLGSLPLVANKFEEVRWIFGVGNGSLPLVANCFEETRWIRNPSPIPPTPKNSLPRVANHLLFKAKANPNIRPGVRFGEQLGFA